MYKTPSQLPESARTELVRTLNERLADGLDLHSQIKVAHWNVRGPQFPALHPLFEQFADQLAVHNDAIAERAVTLGGLAVGSTRAVAKASRLPDYPADTTRDLDHVKLLAERFDAYLAGVRESRGIGEKLGDTDTVDLLTGVITEFEKNSWFLRATLA
jgi:starvation-inducible DNA-binding protein